MLHSVALVLTTATVVVVCSSKGGATVVADAAACTRQPPASALQVAQFMLAPMHSALALIPHLVF